ncbi:ankyrin repeat ph and sec7 domain containing protein secg-related [Anaeramoeba ignava]|uniref:Ankyrin repeat ph and sec7 domain containing protein secg-related n=1 Tax=Anaeramoeba ignava TaxID=1746090 RepID=A0A9Q0R588_ANAIG|nr:ankyrin repeat ph and sec7 domain containing protein secg-related [Anaeramoeba ignava]
MLEFIEETKTETNSILNKLLQSIEKEEIEEIEKIISEHKKAENLTEPLNLNTPLHFACKLGKKEVVELFLKYEADVNFQNDDNQNCLHIVTMNSNSPQIINLLLSKGAQIFKDRFGNSPLIYSLSRNINLESIKLLLENGGNINETDKKKTPLLFIAITKTKDIEILKYLISKGANPKEINKDVSLLELAILSHSSIEIIQFLINLGIDPKRKSRKGFDSLFHALKNKSEYEVIKLLLSYGFEIMPKDLNRDTPIQNCIRSKTEIKILELLLSHTTKEEIENYPKENLIQFALSCNASIEVIEKLISFGVPINVEHPTKGTALRQVFERQLEKSYIKILLENGALVKEPKNDEETKQALQSTLHSIIKSTSETSFVDLLLKKGAVVSSELIPDALRNFPMFEYICQFAQPDIKWENYTYQFFIFSKKRTLEEVKFFASLFKDINVIDDTERTLLHYACRNRYFTPEMLEFLISKGADINKINDSRDTPFQLFLTSNTPKFYEKHVEQCKEMIQIFLKNGAKVNIRDNENGNHVLHQAGWYGCLNPEIWKMLIPHLECLDPLNNYFQTPLRLYQFIFKTNSMTNEDQKKSFPEMIKFLQKYQSYSNDFLKLLERQEFCDLEVEFICGTKYSFHKLIIGKRIGKENIPKFANLCKEKTKQEMDFIIRWIYSGFFNDEKFREKQIEEYFLFVENGGDTYNAFDNAYELILNQDEKAFTEILETLTKLDIIKTKEEMKSKSETSGFINEMKNLYLEDESKDFIIVSNNEEIKVHKTILLARSELFRGMFLSVTDDTSNKVSDYSGKSTQAIKQLIRFLYCDNFDGNLSDEVIEDLEELSIYYQLNQESEFLDFLELKKEN